MSPVCGGFPGGAATHIMFKYTRSRNKGHPIDMLAPGFKMDCIIRGRTGLPWELEI